MIKIETARPGAFSMDYFRFGRGERTLVILPGLSVQSVMSCADAVADAYRLFSDDYTVYVFDRRKELPTNYSIYDMADDTSAALYALGLHKADVLGVSQGGMIAMSIAVKNPDLVEKLVLCSTSADVSGARCDVVEKWVDLAKAGKAEELYLSFGQALYPREVFNQSRELLAQAAKSVTADDLNRFIILAEGTKGFNIANDLERISCPVFLIGSKDDGVLGADATLQIAKRFSDRRDFAFHMYNGYGHAAYDTAPDFKARVLSFLMSE